MGRRLVPSTNKPARPGFYGYRRSDGRVGTRNHVLVVPTVICSAVVAERVAASAAPVAVALPHLAGCGQLGPDMRVTHDTLDAVLDRIATSQLELAPIRQRSLAFVEKHHSLDAIGRRFAEINTAMGLPAGQPTVEAARL